ncbi:MULTISPECIES: signal peptidase I [Hyphomicrobiales]|jgi:signal peptidase I|uniref:Signal peptidase I n=2 Tax=Prosthecodimorpha TaxID=2981530 RepID=A0A0P6VQ54_9HYPH|nr:MULTISPECIES: signal peptidase I [Hyphomicrobiales]KPL54924.1 signal peptidase [Prosthecomicrobium hirschii]MBT9290061.1 signal peptidase I [Prosthecodimorpha staleyi]MCW1840166.1 signal peptidase I [Prosthecomicrobium hirschii]TPQ52420.1 signal peptidase I [Prosthecomicrobium hirschii]
MSVTTTGKDQQAGGVGETIKVVIHALILALLVRTFLYQPFSIPSGSMKSTLLVGDYLFVSKFSYGYGKFSFGGNPLNGFQTPIANFSGRIWASEPKRGDVIVFRNPKEEGTDFIKRLIGLPGDRIQVKHSILYINGEAVPRTPVADFVETDAFGTSFHIRRYRETLPNGVSYTVLDMYQDGSADNTEEYVVPAGHYFMMGDNRDNSTDSRFTRDVGPVPFENLIGRAEIIFFSIDGVAWQFWNWPWSIRWNRLLGTL